MGLDVSSHLHPEGSFDLADHPVPTGREEVWRFTPLKRLRGLHADARARRRRLRRQDRAARRRARPAASRSPTRARGCPAWCRPTGSRARVWARPRRRSSPSTYRPRPSSPSRSWSTVTGRGGEAADRRASCWSTSAHTPRRPSCSRFEGSRHLADNVEIVVGDGAQLTFVTIQDWADDAVHHSTQHARVGRDATLKHVAVSFGGRPRAPRHHGGVRRSRRRGRDARPLLRRRRPAHRAPAVRRPHRAADQEPRRLQGRAAGPGRPHGLDRQRADPQGGRGHRDLRGEPQPRAHRRLPGRLGAQPRDRDRRDRRAPATPRRPAGSTTSSCSTCARAGSRRPRRAGWSCTASSTT